MSADILLERLDGLRRTGPGRWIARCPGHDDRTPSLSIRSLDDGRVLIHDFGGCETAEVLSSLGMDLSDLFPPRPQGEKGHVPVWRPFISDDALRCMARDVLLVTVAAEAVAKGENLSVADRATLGEAASRFRDGVESCVGRAT